MICENHLRELHILGLRSLHFSSPEDLPRDRTRISCTAGGVFTTEPPETGYEKLIINSTANLITYFPIWLVIVFPVSFKLVKKQKQKLVLSVEPWYPDMIYGPRDSQKYCGKKQQEYY